MYIFYKVYYRITCIQSNNDTGNISSIVPMSFENRLRIDPDKFVLKKYVVALIKVSNMLLCKLIEALILIDTNVINLMLVKTIKKKVIQPKTYIHVSLEMVIHQTTSLNES